jgi:hypothetical protein
VSSLSFRSCRNGRRIRSNLGHIMTRHGKGSPASTSRRAPTITVGRDFFTDIESGAKIGDPSDGDTIFPQSRQRTDSWPWDDFELCCCQLKTRVARLLSQFEGYSWSLWLEIIVGRSHILFPRGTRGTVATYLISCTRVWHTQAETT